MAMEDSYSRRDNPLVDPTSTPEDDDAEFRLQVNDALHSDQDQEEPLHQEDPNKTGLNARASIRAPNATDDEEFMQNGSNTDIKKYIDDRTKKLNQKITKALMDQRSSDWTEVKFQTLSSWVTIASFYIKISEKCITRYKTLLKANTIFSMTLSTLAGTLGVLNLNSTGYDFPVKLTFLFANFGLAVFSSYIKIDQIQEKLEAFIKIKQEWTSFSANLSSELVLPLNMRVSCVELISRYKSKFLDLLKVDVEFPRKYKQMIKNEGYSLSQIISTFVQQEDHRLKERVDADVPKEEKSSWKKKKEQLQEDIIREHRRLYTDYDETFRAFHKENKWKVKRKLPNAKPREISFKLYEMYQELFGKLYPNRNDILQMQNLIEIADSDRKNLQVLIWQEYQLVCTNTESACSCFILNSWYKEHIMYPEKKPNDITKQLCEQYDKLPHYQKEFWESKSQLMDVLKPCFISLGIESFMYYITNSKTFSVKYKDDIDKRDWDAINSDFRARVAELSENPTFINQLRKNFDLQQQNSLTLLQGLYDKIQKIERDVKDWLNSKFPLKLNKEYLGLLKHYRSEYNMMNNPFYKAVKMEGFDLDNMFPTINSKHNLPSYV